VTPTYAQDPDPSGDDQTSRRGRGWRVPALLDYNPDPGDLFLRPGDPDDVYRGGDPYRRPADPGDLYRGDDPYRRPGDPGDVYRGDDPYRGPGDPGDPYRTPGEAGPPPPGRPRHRARGRFGWTGGKLLPVTALGVLAVAGLVGGAVLVGFDHGDGSRALPSSFANPTPPTVPASISLSTSAVPSGSPSAPVKISAGKASIQASPVPVGAAMSAPAVMTTPSAAVSSAATSGQAAVVVSYVVDSRGADGFQAEVDVSNNGSSSISGWQIVVALPDDQVTSVQGAKGYVSNHILLLSQASSSPAIAPGATARVFFTAQGVETAPELCAFNNVTCG